MTYFTLAGLRYVSENLDRDWKELQQGTTTLQQRIKGLDADKIPSHAAEILQQASSYRAIRRLVETYIERGMLDIWSLMDQKTHWEWEQEAVEKLVSTEWATGALELEVDNLLAEVDQAESALSAKVESTTV